MTGKKRSSSKKKGNKAKETSPAGFPIGEPCNFEAFTRDLMPVFAAEVLPKLDFKDVLSLAQVNKACNAMVWNEHGVVSLKDKMKVNGNQVSPMLWAASVGNLPAVKALLEAGHDVNQVGMHFLPMSFSSFQCLNPGNPWILESVGAPHSTPLYIAAYCDKTNVMHALIDAGADLDAKCGIEQITALQKTSGIAANVEGTRVLIKAGANVNACDPDSREGPPLTCSAGKIKNTEIVKILIDAGADVNLRHGGRPGSAFDVPLHLAAFFGVKENVKSLLDAGADVDASNKDGAIALCLACRGGQIAVADQLIAAGASLRPLMSEHARMAETVYGTGANGKLN